MQRLGRKGRPTYRMVVQDSRQTPKSGKYVALLGSYDPHSKSVTLNKEKAEFYLEHGARPSDRVVKILSSESVKLPKWVKTDSSKQQRSVRNPEKLRKNQPKEEVVAEPKLEAEPPEEPTAEEVKSDDSASETSEDTAKN